MSCHHHHSHNNHHHHHHSCCCHGCNTSCCPCHPCSCNSSCSSQPPPISDLQNQHHLLQTLLLLQQPLKPHHHQTTPANKDPQHHHSLLQSLLRRIANLETTAQQSQSPPPPPPPQTSTPPPPPPPNKPTIKHLAATTIQTHFRRHLARRSRTLRDLNRLAAVKSHASSLRSSLSEESDPREASQIAMDLLSQLDSIQSRDPMIREGKRSITRELVRVTEFVDKVLLMGKGEESGAVGCKRRDARVRFAENGNGGEVFDELSERVFEVPEGEEGVAHMGGHGFYEMGLSPPLPVTMEPVRSGSKKSSSS